MTTPRVVAVIPAAGVGSRMQADRPKQYLNLANKTILEHTIDALLNHEKIDDVIVAISPQDTYFERLGLHKLPITVVTGGAERADSVLSGLNTLNDNDWALVHDAARPCISDEDITALLHIMCNAHVVGGILATPVRDTMKRVLASDSPSQPTQTGNLHVISHTEDRNGLWHALTPQLFPARLLKQALKEGLSRGETITDEASAMELAGYKVAMVPGSPANIKVTHPADLPLAEFYLQQKFQSLSNKALTKKAQSQCE
ncbi:2-C-methyl-D-erythritol 4-phosphate cytidylyltransferase [Alteromonas sp. D210916BOD_24]|uniref:2-C-methyl-D-erythritol 4-phosphate cytidylyltransferase n=1 Tax=Alteromonas sp. D210916BOD_24 TaxID=3157618 RepID=UPI00399D117D